jgi:hypothetical protein
MPNRRGEQITDTDFTGARFHGVDLTGVTISDAWVHGVTISGEVTGLVVNGVEVADHVEAELDRRHPVRVLLRSEDPDDLRAAWSAIEDRAAETVATARALPPELLDERVGGEWSFIQTLRHLVMATERWIVMPVLGSTEPHHPWGWPNDPHEEEHHDLFDLDALPSLDEVLAVRRDRMDRVAVLLAGIDAEGLAREIPHPYGDGTLPTLHCIHVVMREEWWHDRYATRDLATLMSSVRPPA